MHLVLSELLCRSRLGSWVGSPAEASHFSSASSTIMVLLSISGYRNAAGNTDLLLCNSSLLVPPLKWSFSS